MRRVRIVRFFEAPREHSNQYPALSGAMFILMLRGKYRETIEDNRIIHFPNVTERFALEVPSGRRQPAVPRGRNPLGRWERAATARAGDRRGRFVQHLAGSIHQPDSRWFIVKKGAFVLLGEFSHWPKHAHD